MGGRERRENRELNGGRWITNNGQPFWLKGEKQLKFFSFAWVEVEAHFAQVLNGIMRSMALSGLKNALGFRSCEVGLTGTSATATPATNCRGDRWPSSSCLHGASFRDELGAERAALTLPQNICAELIPTIEVAAKLNNSEFFETVTAEVNNNSKNNWKLYLHRINNSQKLKNCRPAKMHWKKAKMNRTWHYLAG